MPRPDMQKLNQLLTESIGAYQLSVKRSDFSDLLKYVEELETAHGEISEGALDG